MKAAVMAFNGLLCAGVVALTFVTVKVGLQPFTPVSASATPVSSPVSPVLFMFACAAKAAGVGTTGGSLTAVTVMFTVRAGLVLVPSLVVKLNDAGPL